MLAKTNIVSISSFSLQTSYNICMIFFKNILTTLFYEMKLLNKATFDTKPFGVLRILNSILDNKF